MQCNAVLAITGAINRTFQTKLYGELGLEILKFRRWFRRLCTLLKIKTTGVLNYLFKLISHKNYFHNTRSMASMPIYCYRPDSFKYLLFLC